MEDKTRLPYMVITKEDLLCEVGEDNLEMKNVIENMSKESMELFAEKVSKGIMASDVYWESIRSALDTISINSYQMDNKE
ncbi:hypothetical protein [Methanosalsum natronophilum]|uniref:Uncharacterized protein n=1 Tax=Methanosalsum natronophilum TaxID=768733 RepID=A0A424Z3E8_9EURY|nr:hypothetical protein [Methanosalsum natronophilum]MCS3923836.1 hypothetical protein [Methanosalsum natronophilum]RQD89118.1 MAG: hypothetical protein D5R95_02475 [Methanosalsum natronophilum]